MAEDRLPLVRAMIMASERGGAARGARRSSCRFQQEDFEGIFEAMAGLPVTIRLLDPPLHEFLPPLEEAESDEMARRIRSLQEANPMLGTRGCRLGLLYPEIYEMQVRAIVRAALAVEERTGDAPLVEIMHPLVGFAEELRRLRELTLDTASAELEQAERRDRLPRRDDDRAARAPACARTRSPSEADFFSFGTNDLTQTTLGFSRDDAEGKFLTHYLDERILDAEPVRDARPGRASATSCGSPSSAPASVKPDIKLGICGEHGGDARSVAFCHELGLDYVSCSPYRVPLARLAAAQAALAERGDRSGAGRRLADSSGAGARRGSAVTAPACGPRRASRTREPPAGGGRRRIPARCGRRRRESASCISSVSAADERGRADGASEQSHATARPGRARHGSKEMVLTPDCLRAVRPRAGGLNSPSSENRKIGGPSGGPRAGWLLPRPLRRRARRGIALARAKSQTVSARRPPGARTRANSRQPPAPGGPDGAGRSSQPPQRTTRRGT